MQKKTCIESHIRFAVANRRETLRFQHWLNPPDVSYGFKLPRKTLVIAKRPPVLGF